MQKKETVYLAGKITGDIFYCSSNPADYQRNCKCADREH